MKNTMDFTSAWQRISLKPPLEKAVARDVKRAYDAVGCFVANFSQARASKQTPGIPDLYVFPPHHMAPWWHEVKRPGGKQSAAQRAWQNLVRERGGDYVLGGVPEALDHLRRIGLIAGADSQHNPKGT